MLFDGVILKNNDNRSLEYACGRMILHGMQTFRIETEKLMTTIELNVDQ
jgi:hypothetical protein